jgi:ABC-type nitrate/sulfonate/bicarbonate transport system substrate-binding protein
MGSTQRTTLPVTLGSFTPSVVLEVARVAGALEAARLAVTEHAVTSSPAQFRSLIDGDLDLAITSPDNVLAYRYDPDNPLGEVVDARIVAGIDRGLGLGVWGRPGTTVADLRGADIGVDVPTSGFALALFALLGRLGLAPSDYTVVSLGSTPRRLRALLAGECAATMLGAGNELSAAAAGCVRLATVRDELAPYLGAVLAVVGDTHVETARTLARTLAETSTRIVTGDLRAAAVTAAEDRLGLPHALAERYAEGLADPVDGLVLDGVVDRVGLATVVDLRRTWLPREVDGRPVLAGALDDPGLVVP